MGNTNEIRKEIRRKGTVNRNHTYSERFNMLVKEAGANRLPFVLSRTNRRVFGEK